MGKSSSRWHEVRACPALHYDRAVWLALTLMDSGQVARGMSLAQAAHEEALAAGLLSSAGPAGTRW